MSGARGPLVLVGLAGILLAGGHAAIALGRGPAILVGYLDDLLCLPLVLPVLLVLQRCVHRDPLWRLPPAHGLAAVALFAFYFELVLPHLQPGAAADALDGLMYAAGFAIFQLTANRASPHGDPHRSEEEPWTPSTPSPPGGRSRSSIRRTSSPPMSWRA
ncbi:MAG: hypothetical protein AB7V45_11035 [Candidatus Krumholzibacteriia bacterium]